MDIERYTVNGREAVLYIADSKGSPLVVQNNYSEDGEPVMKILKEMACPDLNLLCVGNLHWNHDMTPWPCLPLSPKDTPCSGGANDYLQLLISEIMPKAKELVRGVPSHIGLVGYSLAGLFALYTCYNCDVFDCVVSVSGPLWFSNFKEYVFNHSMKKTPDRIYLSLGDTEASTKNSALKTGKQHRRNFRVLQKAWTECGMGVESPQPFQKYGFTQRKGHHGNSSNQKETWLCQDLLHLTLKH